MGIFRNAPPAYLRSNFLRQLVPGAVVKLEELMDDGAVHEKRFVVVSVGADVTCFVINSAIAQIIQRNLNMLKCQALMGVATHPFMSRDSHVDCFRPRPYAIDHVLDELVGGTGSMLGKITLDLRDEIVSKLLQSSATSAQEKTAFAASLATMT